MLLDALMPRFDVNEIHHRVLYMDQAAAYDTARRLDFAASPITRSLLALRALPELRKGASALRGAAGSRRLTLEGMEAMGFVRLAEEPGVEFVYGMCGKPPDLASLQVSPEDFPVFAEPGCTKVAFNFSLRPYGDSATLVSTETRVISTDDAARRRFRRYWLLIGPFSGLIRREVLRSFART